MMVYSAPEKIILLLKHTPHKVYNRVEILGRVTIVLSIESIEEVPYGRYHS